MIHIQKNELKGQDSIVACIIFISKKCSSETNTGI